MVKLKTFKDYEAYLQAQRVSVRHRGAGPYFTSAEFEKIASWMNSHLKFVRYGICHGARNGLEADEFKKHFSEPGADIFGTDLFPFSGKSVLNPGKSGVVEHDFSVRKEEWVGAFDFVYSNSLDHARDPAEAVSVWLEQLRPGGFLFVQWATSHDATPKKGDCFGANLYEYICLMNSVGELVDLLYSSVPFVRRNAMQARALEVVVLVAKPKGDSGET